MFQSRPVGNQFRKIATDPDAGDYATGFSGWQFLLGQHAAAGLADGRTFQSDGLFDQRLRWSFFEVADVSVGLSLAMLLVFLGACLVIVWWMFKTGYRLKQ